LFTEIQLAVGNALNGHEYDLFVMLDDPLVDKEKYKMIINKFYAFIRYEIY
jgi:hypothetical protein